MAVGKLALGGVVLALLLAGCGGKPEPLDAMCPARTVRIAETNHTFLSRVEMGESDAKPLNDLDGLMRKATLDKDGEALRVAFFLTAVQGCPWQDNQPTLTPVVIKDAKIIAVGGGMLQNMIDDGWTIREETWPWNDYHFGYLPPR